MAEPTLGAKLIRELAECGLRGAILNYDDYQKVEALDSIEELQHFFKTKGMDDFPDTSDLTAIVGFLKKKRENKFAVFWSTWFTCEVLFWLLVVTTVVVSWLSS